MALFACASCVFEAEDGGAGEEDDGAKTAARREAIQSNRAMPEFPAEAVVGVIQRLENGRVADTAVRDTHPKLPPSLDELLSRGGTDDEGFAYADVAGAYSDDGVTETRYQFVVRRKFGTATDDDKRPRLGDTPVGPAPPPASRTPKLSPEAQELFQSSDPDERVEIYARLKQPFDTHLHPSSGLGTVSIAHAEEQRAKKRASISTRKAEAEALQASFTDLLRQNGANDIGGFWTSNAIAATVRVGALAGLAEHGDVEEVTVAAQGGEDFSSEHWDGDDMKAGGGMNAGAYHDKGYTGQAYASLPGGRHMSIAVIGGGFDTDHPGFLDCVGCASRVTAYNCESSPCFPGGVADAPHGTKVAGLAAGSIQQGQIPGYTNQQELERSGVTEEAEPIWLISIDAQSNDVKRAIELGMENDVDVMVSSTGINSTPCSGYVGSDIEDTIYAAQEQGLIFVQALGNSGDPGYCNVYGMAEAPSAFAVGGLKTPGAYCTKDNYSDCGMWTYSSRGGQDAYIDGAIRPAALSLVDVLAPACPLYGSYPGGTIDGPVAPSRGTSWAAPQVAGTGVLIKDAFLYNGHPSIAIEGRLYAVMLAMSDRGDGTGIYRTSGFGDRWGGGRFQARFHDTADMGSAFAWETYSVIHSASGSVWDEPMYPPGPASSSLNQLKAYTMVFEDNNIVMSDFLLYLRTDNCDAGSVQLGIDDSFDVKKMVRLGTSARGQEICIRTHAYHIPPGESRRIHVYAYYSGQTGMR